MTTRRLVKVVEQSFNIRSMFNKQAGYVTIESTDQADIIVLPGGADVNPALYNQEPIPQTHTNSFDDTRDMRYWKEYHGKKMLVGICRGGQFLNIMNGGTMWQHVTNHAVSGTHMLVDLLTDKIIPVTSTHHQMMRANEKTGDVIGIAMEADFWQDDKTKLKCDKARERGALYPKYDTEVIWYKDTRSLCFQPHPEYNSDSTRDYFFDLIDKLY